ncbi:MAG: DNA-3-methyladenine glycosylase [Anaerolineaceae bacterium]|nr:DNA-3-methyladenine glycosylase [Anaerolineaceae bacterium]
MKNLKRSFYNRLATDVARELLGARLVRVIDGQRLVGMITETEAYQGEHDLGCHAHAGKTHRNAVMYGPPGHAYVYFTYGMHWMLNAVTDSQGMPAAVLIRAIQPLLGLDIMAANRPHLANTRHWLDGPAKLTQALKIDGSMDGIDLCDPTGSLVITAGIHLPDSEVKTTPRIGLNKVPEPWKSIPWRFLQVDRLDDEKSK